MPETILQYAIATSGAMLVLAIALVTFRLMKGPTLPDRVIALDLIGTLAAGATGIFAIFASEPIYIIVSIVIALVLFVGTVAFSYHLEQGGGR